MIERTPSTWEVRERFAYEDRYGGGTNAEKAEAFDRWLEEVRAETRVSVLGRVAELFEAQPGDEIYMAVALGGATYVAMVLRAMADKFGEAQQ